MNEELQKSRVPTLSADDARRLLRDRFGKDARVEALPSYSDQNFQVICDTGEQYLLKIANAGESLQVLQMQSQALKHLAETDGSLRIPQPLPDVDGELITEIEGVAGCRHLVRLLRWLPGTFLYVISEWTSTLIRDIGGFMARLDLALAAFNHPAQNRDYIWNLTQVSDLRPYLENIEQPERRSLAEQMIWLFEANVVPWLPDLRRSVIHNDGNDYNLLTVPVQPDGYRIDGIIDFGDMLEAPLVCEPAIAAAYATLNREDPLAAALEVVSGYHAVLPLTREEAELLFYLLLGRLCTSVVMSAVHLVEEPDNRYLAVTAEPAWQVLEKLNTLDHRDVVAAFQTACGYETTTDRPLTKSEIADLREHHLAGVYSLSYREPLQIVRGARQYLFDEQGNAYLDAVNNVPLVGHSHPRVVRAACRQMSKLNTNTRYLHENLVRYCRRLCDTMPDPLSVCFVVNSGSEANDLALRLARTYTDRGHYIVLGGAYHGNLGSLIEISPYKFAGSGGNGEPAHVHTLPLPDLYRGPFLADDPNAGEQYAAQLQSRLRQMQKAGEGCAAFICESLPGCAGQLELPEEYLLHAVEHVHAAGALYIADEVQVGFGRTGTHFWGFQTQGVIPDIVTIGKPAGNGHPLAAVVTTPAIAASFDRGMEYFNTFGGNPVSCAVGLAVLDVIRDERLQEKALLVGNRLKTDLLELQQRQVLIGDVRGRGLFLGVELVSDRAARTPATAEAAAVVEQMKTAGILIATDGLHHNVLKIKPPLVFSLADAHRLVGTLDRILTGITPV